MFSNRPFFTNWDAIAVISGVELGVGLTRFRGLGFSREQAANS